MKTDIFTILLQNFSEVHAKWLENQTQVAFVKEMPEETQAMEPVIWIGIIQSLQDIQLLQTRFMPLKRKANLFNTLTREITCQSLSTETLDGFALNVNGKESINRITK